MHLQSDLDNEIDADTIGEILDSVPEQSLSEEIVPWLTEDFIPFVIKIHPQALVSYSCIFH